MERKEAFRNLLEAFKSGQITPLELGVLTREYFERFSTPVVETKSEIEKSLDELIATFTGGVSDLVPDIEAHPSQIGS
jgi:hypothetical protein